MMCLGQQRRCNALALELTENCVQRKAFCMKCKLQQQLCFSLGQTCSNVACAEMLSIPRRRSRYRLALTSSLTEMSGTSLAAKGAALVWGAFSACATRSGWCMQVQDALGAKFAIAFDITAACSGFVVALTTAAQFIRTGSRKTVVIIGADALSRYIDWTDRGVALLLRCSFTPVSVYSPRHAHAVQLSRSLCCAVILLHFATDTSATSLLQYVLAAHPVVVRIVAFSSALCNCRYMHSIWRWRWCCRHDRS